MSSPVKAAVIGASGYSGIELLRLMLRHPGIELVAVTSRALAGKILSSEFPRLRHIPPADSLTFIEPDVELVKQSGAQVAFLALPHGVSAGFAKPLLDQEIRVIDLSADFRLRSPELYAEFYDHAHPHPELLAGAVYALPEIRADEIRSARLIACPGCYPTSILLPLIPLLKAGVIDLGQPVNVSSMSGASGAGRNASVPLLFCEVNGSLRSYSVPRHRHLSEIGQELEIAAGQPVPLTFVPHLVPVHAGICTTTFVKLASGIAPEQIDSILSEAYSTQPFVRLIGRNQCPDTKHVAGSNFIDIGWAHDPRTNQIILMSAEDNIGKGASSQAIQNFNIAFGYPATAGLMQV
jgi:N-acetyl-gamma-glutamyl-phosphate reductase